MPRPAPRLGLLLRHSRTIAGCGALAATVLSGCGSSVDGTTAAGGGGATSTSSQGGAGQGGAGQGGGDQGGAGQGGAGGDGTGGFAPDCVVNDFDCYCGACEAEGGVCGMVCNNPPSAECVFPEPPGESEFACGAVNCRTGHVCLEVSPMTDGCSYFTCREAPGDCAGEPTCACIEESSTAPGQTSCREENGNVTVSAADALGIPPWENEACGGEVCGPDQDCWGCTPDGGGTTSFGCWDEADNPGGSGYCRRRDF